MRTIKFLVIFLIALFILDSCRKIEKLPVIPSIEFTSFAIFDTTDILGNIGKAGRLKFYFEDGDGDMGLRRTIRYSARYNKSVLDTIQKNRR